MSGRAFYETSNSGGRVTSEPLPSLPLPTFMRSASAASSIGLQELHEGGQGQQLQEEVQEVQEVEEGAQQLQLRVLVDGAVSEVNLNSGLCNMHFKAVPPAGGWSASAGVMAFVEGDSESSDGGRGRGGMAGSRAAAGAGAQQIALEAYAMGSTW